MDTDNLKEDEYVKKTYLQLPKKANIRIGLYYLFFR